MSCRIARGLLTLMGIEHSDVNLAEKPQSWYFYAGELHHARISREKTFRGDRGRRQEPSRPRAGSLRWRNGRGESRGTDTTVSPYDSFGQACTKLISLAERKLAEAEQSALHACLQSAEPGTAPLPSEMCLSCHSGTMAGIPALPLDSREELLANRGLVEKIPVADFTGSFRSGGHAALQAA